MTIFGAVLMLGVLILGIAVAVLMSAGIPRDAGPPKDDL